MEKQTAVEFLTDVLHGFIHPEHGKDFLLIIEQAKEMEKEQIIRTHLMARCYDTENSVNEAEQYYKETFKSE